MAQHQRSNWRSPTGCKCILRRTVVHDISDTLRDQIHAYHADDPEEEAFLLNHLEESGQYDSSSVFYDVVRACPEHNTETAEDKVQRFKSVEKTTRGTLFCKCQYTMLVTRPDPDGEPVFTIGNDPLATRLCEYHSEHRNPDGTIAHEAHFAALKKEYDAVVAVQTATAETLGIEPTAVPVQFGEGRAPQVNYEALGIKGVDDLPRLAASILTLKETLAAGLGLAPEAVPVKLEVVDGVVEPVPDFTALVPQIHRLIVARAQKE